MNIHEVCTMITRKANRMIILVNNYTSLSNRYKNMSINVKCDTQTRVC